MSNTDTSLNETGNQPASSDALTILFERGHGEDLSSYNKLVESIRAVSHANYQDKPLFKKKLLEYDSIAPYDGVVILAATKEWDSTEVDAIQRYVRDRGGSLLVFHDDRKRERINRLLDVFGLSINDEDLVGDTLEKTDLNICNFTEYIECLALRDVFGHRSSTITCTESSESRFTWKDKTIGIRCRSGNGTVMLVSCLSVFGNKQLDNRDNMQLFLNLMKLVTPQEKKCTLAAIEKVEVYNQRKWEELAAMGEEAIDFLIECLEDPKDIAGAAQVLGKIGDTRVVKPMLENLKKMVSSTELEDDDLQRYHDSVPAVARALVNIYKDDLQPLVKIIREYSDLGDGIAVVYALCEKGDRSTSGAVAEWLLYRAASPCQMSLEGPYWPVSPASVISWAIPIENLERLLGGYAIRILGVFDWSGIFTTQAEGRTSSANMSLCQESVKSLCRIDTPISSNILIKVAKEDRLVTQVYTGDDGSINTNYFDYSQWKNMAKEELKRRGNPKHNAAAYDNADAWNI